MQKKFQLLPFLFLFLSTPILAQVDSGYYLKPSPGGIGLLKSSNDTSFQALFGGFHRPQFVNIDFTLDGVEDLLVFDRTDMKHMTFEARNGEYHYAPDYESLFPAFESWVRVYDFNADNKMDIICANGIGGVQVYKNTSTTSQFRLEDYNDDVAHFDPDLGMNTAIYCPPSDVPAIDDIDNDGDMDILAFDGFGSNVTFYQNQSQEVYGHSDSLNFYVATYCWGRFQEADSSNAIRYAPTCFLYKKERHAGSNMLTIDYDDDGDKDLLLSDISYSTVLLLENGWNPNSADGHTKDTIINAYPNFPSNSRSIDVEIFPSMHLIDANFDGKKDLVVAPGGHEERFVVENTWLYNNEGTEAKPEFEFETEAFLQQDAFEMGEYSSPATIDYDGDGDLDLLILAPKPYTNFQVNDRTAVCRRYENVGIKEKPIYELKDDDFLNFEDQNLLATSLCAADVTKDGKKDIVLGSSNGRLWVFENVSENGNVEFELLTKKFLDLKYEEFCAPAAYDFNSDGYDDLIIGKITGKLDVYLSTPDSFELEVEDWGNVQVGIPDFLGYPIARVADVDNDDKPELLVSDNLGRLYFYDDVSLNETNLNRKRKVILNETFSKTSSLDAGDYLSIEVADLNNDSLMDMIGGNRRGGLQFWEGVHYKGTPINVFERSSQLSIYPNPSTGIFKIEANDEDFEAYSIYSLQGKLIKNGQFVSANSIIDVSEMSAGAYVLQLKSGNKIYAKIISLKP